MNKTEWETTLDPAAMIRHLATRGCTGDFATLEDEVFYRIRKEVSEPPLVDFIDNGRTPELQSLAEERMAELCAELASLDVNDTRFPTKSRQLETWVSQSYFRAICVCHMSYLQTYEVHL